MKEMWVGITPNKEEYKYEVRFRTDDKAAYKFVEEACRNAIDINWPDKEPDKIENKVYNLYVYVAFLASAEVCLPC